MMVREKKDFMKHIIIIGAGISGSLITHELSKKQVQVTVLEKSNDVANMASGANSAIIHSGHDPKENTLKAKLNVIGNRMYPELCKELQVDYKPVGAYVVACGQEEEEKIETLKCQCESRNIPYSILTGEQLRKEEPNLSDAITLGLSLPTTGIVTPWQVCIAAMEEAILNGTQLHLNQEVQHIDKKETGFIVQTQDATYKADIVIDCAGVYADNVAKMITKPDYEITPRRGEYFILDRCESNFMKHIIYPVPTKKGKGVLVVPTIHGNLLIGPNAENIEDKEDTSTTQALDYVKSQIGKTVKNVPFHHMIHTYAGLRPSGNTKDFVIKEDEEVENFIHVSCIESPGLASAPAIAQMVVEDILSKHQFEQKESYTHRRKPLVMRGLSVEEKQELIEKDPDCGKIICRCEQISLAEIKDVIHRPCGATTIKGVKRRCRPGMGRCQGGFCEPLVVDILKKELQKDKILQDELQSEIEVAIAKEDL